MIFVMMREILILNDDDDDDINGIFMMVSASDASQLHHGK